ncbi:SMI1/KNR4 family protein [Planctomicrobium sp. SH664]|uniref:SMI1/KNR4 family protein n=1 Tax=Planctomicrobium sp. SH664 TaxID=3448125 RepID=UPI003F5C5727
MLNLQQFWEETEDAPPGLTPKDLQLAEKRLKVSLPQSLVKVLSVQNGGYVRYEEVNLFQVTSRDKRQSVALASKLLDDDALEMVQENGGHAEQILIFADEHEGHTLFGLDYHECGPQGEPDVIAIDLHCGYCERIEGGVDDFLNRLSASDAEPAVDWNEISEYELLAEEVIEIPVEAGEPAPHTIDQRLCESGTSFILFRQERQGDFELLTRFEIVKPLDAEQCLINTVQNATPALYQIQLAAEPSDFPDEESVVDPDDYEEVSTLWSESRSLADGRWKNRNGSGEPAMVTFESADREKLVQLRVRLIGGELSERALAQEEWQERMQSLSDDEIEVVYPQMMQAILAEARQTLDGLDLNRLPPSFQAALQQFAEYGDETENLTDSKQELDPELLGLMKKMLTLPPKL